MANLTRDGFEMEQKFRKEKRRRLKNKAGMLTGGQAKIAAKAPPTNKIDEKDFAVLRAEKAKGRGKGLQDEKMKPGKVMKAMLGVMAIKKAGNKISKKSGTPKAMGLGVGVGAIQAKKIKEILGRDKGGMGEAKDYKKYLRGLERVTSKTRYEKAVAKRKALEASKKIGSRAMDAAKATRIGKIAAGVAAAALAAKAGLEKMYEKRTGKKPFTKRPDKKMGGGMMMRRPMMAKKGKLAALAKKKGLPIPLMTNPKFKFKNMGIFPYVKPKKKMAGGLSEATQKLKAQGKMGGGMMQRPMMAMGGGMMPGYKKGKSVMAKGCKLGRKKPTKMYT